VASPLSLPFSILLPFIFQEAKESIDEEDPRPTSSNGAYIILLHLWPNLLGVFYPMPLGGRIASTCTIEKPTC